MPMHSHITVWLGLASCVAAFSATGLAAQEPDVLEIVGARETQGDKPDKPSYVDST